MTAEECRIAKNENIRQSNMERYGFGPNIMRNIRVCPKCGVPSTAADRNCHTCGAKLPRETLFQQYRKRHRFCPRCDMVVAESAQFCPECGTRIHMFKPLKLFW